MECAHIREMYTLHECVHCFSFEVAHTTNHIRMYEFRWVLYSVQIQFREDRKFVIDDGYQEPITLISDERGVIGATFSKYMLKNIG